MEATRPNNDLRPYERGDDRHNDPWSTNWDPNPDGYMDVIGDCDEHLFSVLKADIGFVLPHCTLCAQRRLDGNTEGNESNDDDWMWIP